jgi:hypothetical protein
MVPIASVPRTAKPVRILRIVFTSNEEDGQALWQMLGRHVAKRSNLHEYRLSSIAGMQNLGREVGS